MFSQNFKILPVMSLKSASDQDGTNNLSEYIDMADVEALAFVVQFNTIDTSDAESLGLSVLASSTTTAAGAAIYPLWVKASAAGADSFSAPVSTDSTISVTSDDSNTVFILEVDPRVVAEAGDDKRYVYFSVSVTTAEDNGPVGSWSGVAMIRQRHQKPGAESTTA